VIPVVAGSIPVAHPILSKFSLINLSLAWGLTSARQASSLLPQCLARPRWVDL
jgi:hypothetical protein